MKIAVTGASGHIGCNLVRALLAEGEHRVSVLQYHDQRAFQHLDVEVVKGSLHDKAALEKLCRGAEVVFHLAVRISIGSLSFEELFETNVEGTRNLLQVARNAGVKKFIHFSSIHALEYKPSDEPMDETRQLVLQSDIFYERSKAVSEKWVLEQSSDDFEVVVLNPTSVIGPCDFKPSLMGQMLIKLYKNTLPALIPGGYDWVDVRDVVSSAISAIENGRNGERYILSGGWTTLKELADRFAAANHLKLKNKLLPLWLVRAGIPFIHAWSKLSGREPLYTNDSLTILQSGNRKISYAKAARELGHNPRPLEETLKDTIDWFVENNYL